MNYDNYFPFNNKIFYLFSTKFFNNNSIVIKMSVLNFLTQGGMGSIGGDLTETDKKQLKTLAKLFGESVRQIARERRIAISVLTVWNANYLFSAIDKARIYFIFVNTSQMTTLRFNDLRQKNNVDLKRLLNQIRLDVGEPIFGFQLPISMLKEDETGDLSIINDIATNYIDNVISDYKEVTKAQVKKVDDQFCFIIMSFSNNPTLKDFYEKAIKPVVTKLGYRCERIDEQEFNGKIMEKIIENIKVARFIVADLTESRPNCYYELGIAHAFEKSVIHIANSEEDIHFDIKDFNFIIYSRIDELKERLKERILKTIKS